MSKDDIDSDGRLNFGGFPHPPKNISITISGLEQWKDGIVFGAEVRVDILQNDKCIHSEVFSGKCSAPFTRVVSVPAAIAELVTVHNRPDLPMLKVSAEFSDAVLIDRVQVFIKQVFIKDGIVSAEPELSENLRKKIDDAVTEGIRNSLRPGGLLYDR